MEGTMITIIALSAVGGLLLLIVLLLLFCICRKGKTEPTPGSQGSSGKSLKLSQDGEQQEGMIEEELPKSATSRSSTTAEVFDIRNPSQRSGKGKMVTGGNVKLTRGQPGLTAPILPLAPTKKSDSSNLRSKSKA